MVVALLGLIASIQVSQASADHLVFEADQRVVARDGVELSVRIWRPEGSGRHPVVVVHTPYLSDETQARARKFVAAGFAYASIDRRGRGASGGQYRPLENTGPDGADVVAWLAAQPWSDGRVVSRGGSYRGMTQWQMLAEHPEALVASVPTASVYPGWDFPQPRGIFLSYAARWLAFVEGRASNPGIFADAAFWNTNYKRVYLGELPFSELARASGVPGDTFDRWLAHPAYDDFWASLNPTPEQYARMTQPILSITGAFDGDQEGTLRYYREHLEHAPADVGQQHWLLIGPWNHAGTRTPGDSVQGLVFESQSKVDIDQLHIDWYDHLLHGKPHPELLADRVTYYVIGAEQWRSASSLEAISNQDWDLYLSANGQPADHLYASGTLLDEPVANETFTRYRFDPTEDNWPDDRTSPWSSGDNYAQHADAFRPNQLFFHSAPLSEARTVCGEMTFEAEISIDVPDTDISVQVFEITRNNQARWLGADYRRARFRNSFETEQLATPGAIERWRFDRFWWTCRQLEAGSHLRLVIGPVDTPDLHKNDHRGESVQATDYGRARPAEIRIHHSASHPARLRLPLLES